MTAVTIADCKVWVGDQPVSLFGGEVHYWRLDPANWRPVLKRVREMGIQVVATYACWDFHELSPGVYDFTGASDPRRNLVGFLELLTEAGFWIIFRPGPYIYSEWSNNGVPDYAAQYDRLAPAFWELAERYMQAVTEAAKPFMATRGGKIILWQSDNEIDPWPHIHTEALGLGKSVGAFHRYLEQRYRTVEALNTAWRTAYTRFEDARAVSELFVEDPVLLSRYHDFRAFLHEYVYQVACRGVTTYRSLGVDVPILLNTYSGVGTQSWADLETLADIVGPDIYPSREFRFRGNGEHRHVLEAVRYTRAFSKLPYIPEYEAGIWHDWLDEVGSLPPNHYRLIGLSALQAGAAGWNWYMLVNRDNWYQSPINEWGRVRPGLYDVFRQLTSLFYTIDPPTLTRQTETAVTFDPLQRSTDRPGQNLLHAFYEADLDYEFFDLARGHCDKPIVFYAGGVWLSEQGQRKLLDYVNKGGHLVCVGAYPKLDEHMHDLNLLDIPAPSGILGGSFNLQLLDAYSVESPYLHFYDTVPGEAISATRLPVRNPPSEELHLQFGLQTGQPYTVGYSEARGQGRLTVIGLNPTPALLTTLHQHFGVATACRSYTRGVTSALFSRNDERYIIATNAGSEEKQALIQLEGAGISADEWQAAPLLGGTVTFTGTSLSTGIGAKDGVVIRLTRR